MILPENLTCIGDKAFLNCSNIASIIIPTSVKYIGESAFCRPSAIEIYCRGSSMREGGWHSDWDYSIGTVTVVWKYK
jgi:hypothetical protein